MKWGSKTRPLPIIRKPPLDPGAVTYLRRAVSFQKKGENEKALADYQEAIRLSPGYVSALNNRGLIYLQKRRK